MTIVCKNQCQRRYLGCLRIDVRSLFHVVKRNNALGLCIKPQNCYNLILSQHFAHVQRRQMIKM